MSVRDIEITIDEILLDAPFGARREALRAAIAESLGRLFAERGAPGGGGDLLLHIPRAAFDVPPGLRAEAIADRVAEGLYERLGGARGGRR
jgi:hypothetical protein